MSKEKRFEVFYNDELGKWVIKDNEQLPNLLDSYKSCVRLNELNDKLSDLQSQLADKDKEIEKLKGIKIIPAPINGEDTKKFLKNLDQQYFVIADTNEPQVTILDQNQKAIEQLEKVKKFFLEEHRDEEMDTDYIITKDAGEIADFLLNQIRQLKDQQINELKRKVEDVNN